MIDGGIGMDLPNTPVVKHSMIKGQAEET